MLIAVGFLPALLLTVGPQGERWHLKTSKKFNKKQQKYKKICTEINSQEAWPAKVQ
jgi:hypothetical protein